MIKQSPLQVQGIVVNVIQEDQKDYISLTDIAKYKNKKTDMLIQNWMRNRNTLEYLGLREIINNPNFKPLEFEVFKKDAGLNAKSDCHHSDEFLSPLFNKIQTLRDCQRSFF